MAERVFPACRRSPLFLSFPFFFLVSLFFFFVLSPFCPAPGQRRYICLPFSCAAGLLIIHSRANIVSVRIVTHPANRKIQFFSRCLSFLRPPRVFTSLKQRDRERESRDQLSGRRQVSLFLSSLFLEFKMSYSSFSSFTNEWKNRLVSQKV